MAVTATLLIGNPSPAGNAFAYVDCPTTTPAGALVVALATWVDDSGVNPTGVDETLPDAGMTWTKDAEVHEDTLNNHMGIAIYSAPAPSGMGTSRVMIGFDDVLSWGCDLTVLYLEGVDVGASRVDDVGVPSWDDGSDIPWATGSIDPATAGAALLSVAMNDGGFNSIGTVTSPATKLNDFYNGSNAWNQIVGFRVAGAAGSYTIAGTWPNTPAFGEAVLGIAYKAASGWTKEQAQSGNANTTGATLAFPSDVKAGSLLLACMDCDQASTGPPSDTRGNVWTPIRDTTTANGQRVVWWYAISKDAGACSVTVDTVPLGGYSIAEFSTTAGTITLDVEGTAYRTTSGAGTDKFSTASVMASAAGSLAVSFLGTDTNANADLAAGTSCALDTQGPLSGTATADRVAIEHDEVGAGSVALPWTTTGDFSGQVHVAVFKTETVAAEKQSFYLSRRRTVRR